jgi:hypothetical protein
MNMTAALLDAVCDCLRRKGFTISEASYRDLRNVRYNRRDKSNFNYGWIVVEAGNEGLTVAANVDQDHQRHAIPYTAPDLAEQAVNWAVAYRQQHP